MKKYAVLEDIIREDNINETEVIGVFDTQEEAEEKAVEAYDGLSEKQKETHKISVGEISEEDLEEVGDWASFKAIDILWEVEDLEEA